MWKKLKDTEYFLLFGKDLEVCVTNYVSIWRLKLCEASFLACLKDSNFGLEIDGNELKQKGKQMLTNPETLKSVRLNEDGNTLSVTMTIFFDFPLRLQMKLTEGSKELFFQKITLDLLKTIQDLRASQIELRDSLKKKDLEIEEYKCEGGEIALRFLKTIPFNDEGHILKHPLYGEHFGPTDIPDCLLNKVIEVPEIRAVKEEACRTNMEQKPSETNGTIPKVKIEDQVTKMEPADVKTQDSVKTEPSMDIKQEDVKSELFTNTQPPSRIQARPGTAGPSPSKRNRRKLNL